MSLLAINRKIIAMIYGYIYLVTITLRNAPHDVHYTVSSLANTCIIKFCICNFMYCKT